MGWFGFQAPRTLPSLFPAPFPCRRSTLRLIQAEKRNRAASIVEPGLAAMEAGESLPLYHRLVFFFLASVPAGVAELAIAGCWGKWVLAAVAGTGLVGHGAPLGCRSYDFESIFFRF